VARGCFVKGEASVNRLQPLFRRMPIPALRVMGSLLYRHMG
jgi:hypothetical protein